MRINVSQLKRLQQELLDTKLVLFKGEWIKISRELDHPDLPSLIEQRRVKEIRKSVSERRSNVAHTCGNCRYLKFHGVQAMLQSMGTCARGKISQRWYNKPTENGCDLWSIKSDAVKISEDERAACEREKLSKIAVRKR